MNTRLNKRLAYFQDNFVDDPSEEDVDLSQYYYKRDHHPSASSSPVPSNSSASWSQSMSQDRHSSDVAYEQFSPQRQQQHQQQQPNGGSAVVSRTSNSLGTHSYLNSQDGESSSSPGRANGTVPSNGAMLGSQTTLADGSANAFNESMAKAQHQNVYDYYQPNALRDGPQIDGMLPTAPPRAATVTRPTGAQLRSPTMYQNQPPQQQQQQQHQYLQKQQHLLGQHPQQEYRPSESILTMLNAGNTAPNAMMNQSDEQRLLLLQQQQQQRQQQQMPTPKSMQMNNSFGPAVGMSSMSQQAPQHLSSQMPFQQHQSFQQQGFLGGNSQIQMQQQLQQQHQQQQLHQRHQHMKRKSQKPSTEDDRFDLLGLLSVINMTDDDTATLAIGYDLTGLGLNLNSSDPLFSNFASPWSNGPSYIAPQFKVPDCYISEAPPKDATYVQKFMKFTEETLFYIFYTMPKDISQVIAAKQLSSRGWRYHKEMKMWFTQVPGTQLLQKTATFESGSYMYFDINTWKLERKDGIVLRYEDLMDGI